MAESRTRFSLQALQEEYDNGNHAPLEKVVRAWKGIQAKSEDDPNNFDGFFVIGGYHGEPFHGPGKTDPNNWWGGYCNRNNILFPTWHRAYLWRLEEAMRKIPGCEDVTLPFWDEYAGYWEGKKIPKPTPRPIPSILTSKTFPLDGKEDEPNPLYLYKLPADLKDAKTDKDRYTKPKGYTTVRYPLSGLVSAYDKRMTRLYNESFAENDLVSILNDNVFAWLNQGPKIDDDGLGTKQPDTLSVGVRYQNCLQAPNYMVFSNNVSAKQWIEDHPGQASSTVSLESPHNAIHLSLGGMYQQAVYNADQKAGYNANGDMGENNTAGLDPIFFFHHCFVDYVFHLWQKKNDLTKTGQLTVELGYPGTNSLDNGAPPAFQPANVFLDMETPLYPFKKSDGSWYNSHDVTDIEMMGYSYGSGSMDGLIAPAWRSQPIELSQTKRVTGINRLDYGGSFVVRTYAIAENGTKYEVGREEVLSRWNVSGCRNCQNSLEVKSFVPVPRSIVDSITSSRNPQELKYVVSVQGHEGEEEIDATITTL